MHQHVTTSRAPRKASELDRREEKPQLLKLNLLQLFEVRFFSVLIRHLGNRASRKQPVGGKLEIVVFLPVIYQDIPLSSLPNIPSNSNN